MSIRLFFGNPFFGMSILLVLFLAGLIGCQSSYEDQVEFYRKIDELKVTPAPVVLRPGDEVEIKFYSTPELDEQQEVRPDGKISLQLLGDVLVDGKTPEEIRSELKDRYAERLQDPEIAVIVRDLVNRKIFVGGEVLDPGIIEMKGSITALEAIMEAGGFNMDTAEYENVVVIRHKEGRRYGCALNFDEALEGEVYDPFFLEPHDIVFVPQTTIVKVTTWIDQHINRIIPLGFTLTEDRGDSTIGISKYGTPVQPNRRRR